MIFIFIALSRPVSDKFAVHLPRYSCKSVSGVLSLLSTWHGSSSHYGMSGLFSRRNE